MNIKFIKTAMLTIVLLLFAVEFFGQKVPNNKPNINNFLKAIQSRPKINVFNGSVYANFAEQKVTTQEIVGNLNGLLKLDSNHSFEQISTRNDELGFTHINFQELYKGYPVDGYLIMFHEKDGLLKSVSGNFAVLQNNDITINIDDNKAIDIAKEHLGVTKVFKENPVLTVFTQNQTDKRFYLSKKVRIESFAPLMRYDVFVDARTGEILQKISLIHSADVQGRAKTLFSGIQTITCDSRQSGGYRLYDNARKIGTYNGATWDLSNFPSATTLYSNISTTWSNNPALDVHWGMEKTYDYYKTVFNRNSYDGYGGEIYNIYNPEQMYYYDPNYQLNAAAIGYGMMIYGSGDVRYGYRPFVSLDCAAHEYTHMVTNDNGNGGLNYQGESGALNESFSDIFGTSIEFYANINPNWTIGEDIMIGTFMRSMSNPNIGYVPQPDTYLGNNWQDTNSSYDAGGVHINSGVQNLWFYLLCQGGSGTNDLGNAYSVTGIGINKAQKIAYRNLMNYIAPNANYIDAYNGSSQAAADLFGNPSAEYTAVKQAWYAVGIDDSTQPPIQKGCGNNPIYFTAPSDTFDDGSGSENYLDNQQCIWVIEPQGATSITLSFSEFDTEENYDFVRIYDNYNLNNPIATLSGNTIPAPITTTTGVMIVVFTSDQYDNRQGFTANYVSSTQNLGCDGTLTYLTSTSGWFDDRSGAENYKNNQLCRWVISPSNATSVTLSFSQFDTEKDSDFVYIYDNTNYANLGTPLAKYSGDSIPSSVTSNTGIMLVVFETNDSITADGWTAFYTSDSPTGCNGGINYLTAASGTFDDGSGSRNYLNDQQCIWAIEPPGAKSITLSFSEFNTEPESDFVYIFNSTDIYNLDYPNIIGFFSGNTIPEPVTSNTGVMLVLFYSDGSITYSGFTANYTSNTSGVEQIAANKIVIFPNPAQNIINIKFAENQQNTTVEIYDMLGKLVKQYPGLNIQAESTQKFNIENIPNGIYNIKIISNKNPINHKLIISR